MERISYEGEVWKEIEGFEGLYEVSTYGRVWSARRGRMLATGNVNGYRIVCMRKDRKSTVRYVHRLVLEAFRPNEGEKKEVNHINEDRSDNRLENLEWMSHLDNVNYGSHTRRMLETKVEKGQVNPEHVGMDHHEQMRRWQKENWERYRNYQDAYNEKRREKRRMDREMMGLSVRDYKQEVREIPGCPGYYADRKGNIISRKRVDEKVMSKSRTRSGYQVVALFLDKKLRMAYVSRLVLAAFYGYPAEPHLCYANHKDGNLDNCSLKNLEWIVCETTADYDPTKSKRKGILKPEGTRARMTEAKYHQSPETRQKGAETRKRTCKERNERRRLQEDKTATISE